MAAGPAPKQSTQTKILTFPDVPVAVLEAWRLATNGTGPALRVRDKILLRGKVELPVSGAYNLTLKYDGLEHLESLAQLAPGQVVQFGASSLDLDDKQFAFFKRFPGITRINLDSTMITDKSMPVFATFRNLSDLRLSKVDITGAGFENLVGLPIYTLNLEGSNLKAGNLQKITTLPNTLQSINCTRTGVSNADIAFLGKCTKLNCIDLSGDKQITNDCVKDIVKLKNLDTLLILDTSITDVSLPALAKMPHLKRMVVRARTFWKTGTGKSPRPSLLIEDGASASRTPVDVFGPLHPNW